MLYSKFTQAVVGVTQGAVLCLLHIAAHCCTLLHIAVLCCTLLCFAVLCCTLLCIAALCCTLLHFAVLCCALLHFAVIGWAVRGPTKVHSAAPFRWLACLMGGGFGLPGGCANCRGEQQHANLNPPPPCTKALLAGPAGTRLCSGPQGAGQGPFIC